MKSKRRHELQTNALADWLGNKVALVQPYSSWLIGGVIVILAIVILLSIRANRQQTASEDGWLRFQAAKDNGYAAISQGEALGLENAVRELKGVSDEYEDTPLAAYADMTLGDLNLRSGQTKYMSNKSAAREHFKNAAKHYETAVQKAVNDEFKNRARFSLAKSYEWQLKLEKAKETYALVEGAFADQAQTRARDLNRTSTHDFYDKYAKWVPKKTTPTGNLNTRPNFELNDDPPPSDGEMEYGQYLDATIDGSDIAVPTTDASDTPVGGTDGTTDADDTAPAPPGADSGQPGDSLEQPESGPAAEQPAGEDGAGGETVGDDVATGETEPPGQ